MASGSDGLIFVKEAFGVAGLAEGVVWGVGYGIYLIWGVVLEAVEEDVSGVVFVGGWSRCFWRGLGLCGK